MLLDIATRSRMFVSVHAAEVEATFDLKLASAKYIECILTNGFLLNFFLNCAYTLFKLIVKHTITIIKTIKQ